MFSSSLFPEILRFPDQVTAVTEQGIFALKPDTSGAWVGGDVQVDLNDKNGLSVQLRSDAPVKRLALKWSGEFPSGTRFLGDDWERGYGDFEWLGLNPERILPWYFVASNGQGSAGYGVETQPNALCYWQLNDTSLTLVLDVSNGAGGVQLGERVLDVATVRSVQGESAFATSQALCRALCSNPRLPRQPVYGGNDWYYAYGENSRDTILRDSATIAELSATSDNRPFMVIDDGWQGCRAPQNGGPWNIVSPSFGDMAEVASSMKSAGVRPGLWFRPLQTVATIPSSWKFPRRGGQAHVGGIALDPSVPEVLDLVATDMERFREWGYEMVKHDFSMYDIFAKWGNAYKDVPAGSAEWHFADRSRTTAEIIKGLYSRLRESAGDGVMLIGCNTIGHLGAGLFELQRTGDDTSGEQWERTRKMGVNTLAFRMPQHDNFFAVDADCVGLTTHVPWELNQQWLDVLARSGTPLFVSPAPDALGAAQRAALREAFAIASQPQPVAEPLDWFDTTCPRLWKMGEETRKYRWSE